MMEESIKWDRFNAVIVTRHGGDFPEALKELYQMNLAITSHIPYPKVCVDNPPAINYMIHLVDGYKDQFDWVINLDDDAFLTNFKALYDLMVYMEENEYDICGMADGGTFTPRDVFNPVSMNPFFNVIQLKTLKKRLTNGSDMYEMLASYDPAMIAAVDQTKIHPEIYGTSKLTGTEYPIGYEPYYPFFYAMVKKNAKLLWLYGRSYTYEGELKDTIYYANDPRRATMWHVGKKGLVHEKDPWTTVLYNHEGKELCYHAWYARYYGGAPSVDPTAALFSNDDRIQYAFLAAADKLGIRKTAE